MRAPWDDMDVYDTSGNIKWFDAHRAYGFIVPDDGQSEILLPLI